MTDVVFAITIFSEVLLGGSLILTMTVPVIRVWPPPGKNSWQYRYTWTMTILSMLGTIVLGLLDWNTFILHDWVRFAIGGPLIVGGLLFALWSVRTLGVHASLSLGGKLIDQRPYKGLSSWRPVRRPSRNITGPPPTSLPISWGRIGPQTLNLTVP